MGDVKDKLTEGVRKIVDEKYGGKEFTEDLAKSISDDICEYLWKNGLSEDVIPVIDISVDDEGYVDIQVLDYPNEESFN